MALCSGIIIFIIFMAMYAYRWYHPTLKPGQPVFQQSQEVIKEKIVIPGPERIKIVDRIITEKKMPGLVIPQDSVVTATADFPSSKGGYVAATVMDSQGNSIIQYEEKPQPFFELPNEREVMLRYGVSSKDGQVGTMAVRWTVLRLGDVRISTYGEVNAPRTDAKAMVEASYRF